MYAKFSDKNNLRSDEARRNLSVSRKRIPRILGVTLVVDGFVKIFADTTFITTSRLDGKWPYHLHNPIKNVIQVVWKAGLVYRSYQIIV